MFMALLLLLFHFHSTCHPREGLFAIVVRRLPLPANCCLTCFFYYLSYIPKLLWVPNIFSMRRTSGMCISDTSVRFPCRGLKTHFLHVCTAMELKIIVCMIMTLQFPFKTFLFSFSCLYSRLVVRLYCSKLLK